MFTPYVVLIEVCIGWSLGRVLESKHNFHKGFLQGDKSMTHRQTSKIALKRALSNVHFVLRGISALLDPSWGSWLPTSIHLVRKQQRGGGERRHRREAWGSLGQNSGREQSAPLKSARLSTLDHNVSPLEFKRIRFFSVSRCFKRQSIGQIKRQTGTAKSPNQLFSSLGALSSGPWHVEPI